MKLEKHWIKLRISNYLTLVIIICFFLDSPAGYVCMYVYMYVCCPGGFSIFANLT